jgi:hypothetical protein
MSFTQRNNIETELDQCLILLNKFSKLEKKINIIDDKFNLLNDFINLNKDMDAKKTHSDASNDIF